MNVADHMLPFPRSDPAVAQCCFTNGSSYQSSRVTWNQCVEGCRARPRFVPGRNYFVLSNGLEHNMKPAFSYKLFMQPGHYITKESSCSSLLLIDDVAAALPILIPWPLSELCKIKMFVLNLDIISLE